MAKRDACGSLDLHSGHYANCSFNSDVVILDDKDDSEDRGRQVVLQQHRYSLKKSTRNDVNS